MQIKPVNKPIPAKNQQEEPQREQNSPGKRPEVFPPETNPTITPQKSPEIYPQRATPEVAPGQPNQPEIYPEKSPQIYPEEVPHERPTPH